MKVLNLILLFTITSCSLFQGKYDYSENDYPIHSSTEYENFLASKPKEFLKTYKKEVKLYGSEKRYLKSLIQKILEPNKKFFVKIRDINFIIVKSKSPYYLSAPPNNIILSTELFGDYVENENLLVSILTYELVRLENLLYPRRITAPIGVVDEADLIAHTQVSRETRTEVHKWSYRILKRTIFDESIYLLWMQIMMRNTKDFKLHFNGEEKVLSEERDFKAFMIQDEKLSGTTFKERKEERRTPRVFYNMLNRLKNVK